MSPSLLLLPYSAVLVPGAGLTLRLVDPGHLDLMRECSRRDAGFGMCLLDASSPETAATLATHGTQACIEDFSTGDDGVPTLRVRGGRRFQVRHRQPGDNGVITAQVDWRDPDPDDPLRPEHAVLGLVLARILEQAGVDATPAQLDMAAWIGWRLAEWLPLSEPQRQELLQEDDPHARLDHLLVLLSSPSSDGT
ncbi:LON peptidase substrate-binding domain-containing protein [Cognatiluteimonas profundi]|uniref:LON peptidase substrate-binding domain-containing protein n=1 Tax=Cognatiluteimonas profundi TaxID=2594501 RepID=UPI00131BC472|nr:LON peptidase substrate-binding domain-containing protein [Lysobacter profundi]